MFISGGWNDYEVLDTGGGAKLERWGAVTLERPDPQAIWPPARPDQWRSADAAYIRSDAGGGHWEFRRAIPDRWEMRYGALRFYVRPTGFKHTGLFPEQAANWDWMSELIRAASRPISVLNLFAYTGGATLACAAAGATVTHVDAAKGMTQWARANYALSGLPNMNARWIVDDALAFVEREIRRGRSYDAILMDPPSYGRGPGGEVWKIERDVYRLVEACAKLMSGEPLFFLINSYTTGLAPSVLSNVLSRALSGIPGIAHAQELALPVSSGGVLPCGSSGRWTAKGAAE
ncbi:MAG: class I SAM-dependent methyltransferase [Oscillospiraceae bacterium]|jgi:23S rRNA (cytosine1962-C5)-methyltransferase|nr:class I SAM-dependent methyltransferase [Oscillospiraceae bacterium]